MNLTALILALVALIYGLLALRDFLKNGYQLSPAARIWLRIAIIFTGVVIFLCVAFAEAAKDIF